MRKIGKYLQEICILIFTIIFCVTSIFTSSIESVKENTLSKKSSSNLNKVVDPSTANNYTNVLGSIENDGGRYAGRVWTDKSVYQNDLDNIDGIENANISLGNNEEFLVSFSALGSSRILNGESNSPIDLVLAIDTSGSMYTNSGRIDNTLAATNTLLDTFLSLNENNRVSIVLFDTNAKVLAPLDHYTKRADKNFVTRTGSTENRSSIEFNYVNKDTGSNDLLLLHIKLKK